MKKVYYKVSYVSKKGNLGMYYVIGKRKDYWRLCSENEEIKFWVHMDHVKVIEEYTPPIDYDYFFENLYENRIIIDNWVDAHDFMWK